MEIHHLTDSHLISPTAALCSVKGGGLAYWYFRTDQDTLAKRSSLLRLGIV